MRHGRRENRARAPLTIGLFSGPGKPLRGENGCCVRPGGVSPQAVPPGADAQTRATLVTRWQREHGGSEGRLTLYRACGCDQCGGHGYRGRLGIHELMLADDALRAHIRHRESVAVLQGDARAAGMRTLRQDGIDKVLAGHTDLGEVLAATNA